MSQFRGARPKCALFFATLSAELSEPLPAPLCPPPSACGPLQVKFVVSGQNNGIRGERAKIRWIGCRAAAGSDEGSRRRRRRRRGWRRGGDGRRARDAPAGKAAELRYPSHTPSRSSSQAGGSRAGGERFREEFTIESPWRRTREMRTRGGWQFHGNWYR